MAGSVDALLLVVADGVRPDVLLSALDAGQLPALDALRGRGALHTVSTCFPSVTGPAYLPFLMGRHPGALGMPGLRWYDRTRSLRLSIGNARSYSGIDIWRTHDDVTTTVPSLLDLAQPSLSSMSIYGRGATLGNIGRSMMDMARVTIPHFTGNSETWRDHELRSTAEFMRRFERHKPRFSLLVINTPDKRAHKLGVHSAEYVSSLNDVDAAVAQAGAIAVRGGWRDRLAIWVLSDHGHAAVSHHDDLHGWMESLGHRVIAHPQLRVRNADVALMVGGNAMAHVYVEPATRQRAWWGDLEVRWQRLHDAIVQRPSVDVAVVALSEMRTRVTSGLRGSADLVRDTSRVNTRYSYIALEGDPLELGGSLYDLDANAAWLATIDTERPDSIVQLSSLMQSSRSGDIVISASRGWDLRQRFEPVAHVSTHGALLREQMLVPLLVDRPVTRKPQRTTEVVPSALRVLGIDSNASFDDPGFL